MELKLNEIYHMNCLDGIKKIPDGIIKTAAMDPPYFLGMTGNGQKGEFSDLAICTPFYRELAQELKRVLRPDGEFYIFCDWRSYAFYYPVFAEILPVMNLIVWDKVSGPGNHYSFTHELIIYGSLSPINRGSSNIWRIPGFSAGAKKTNGPKRINPQKPIEIMEKIILDSTKEGDTVLDCFMGTGTTAKAALKHNRQFIGFELKESHYQLAQEEIKKFKQSLKTQTDF